jgi:hypothetical protein
VNGIDGLLLLWIEGHGERTILWGKKWFKNGIDQFDTFTTALYSGCTVGTRRLPATVEVGD